MNAHQTLHRAYAILAGIAVANLGDEIRRNEFIRNSHPRRSSGPRLTVVATGRQIVLVDVLYPKSGRLDRVMLSPNLWGSLQHSARCRGSLGSAWAHLYRHWFREGYLDAGNVQTLLSGRSTAGRAAAEHSRAIREDPGTSDGFAAKLELIADRRVTPAELGAVA